MVRSARLATGDCSYCPNPAITTEHCPPKILFRNSDVPKGWDFPACERCNNGTSASDQIFAFFVYSNLLQPTRTQWKHFEKIGRGIKNNNEAILDDVLLNAAPIVHSSLSLGTAVTHYEIAMSPLLSWHLDRVVDKLTLSAYLKLLGKVAPDACAVWHAWLTNSHIATGDLQKIPKMFGKLEHIRQGRKTSQGQFAYQHAVTTKGDAIFRFAFQNTIVLLSAVIIDPEALRARAVADKETIDVRAPLQAAQPKCQLLSVAHPNLVLRPVFGRHKGGMSCPRF